MSMYGAEFVKAAPQLLAVDGEGPPNPQFKVRDNDDLGADECEWCGGRGKKKARPIEPLFEPLFVCLFVCLFVLHRQRKEGYF